MAISEASPAHLERVRREARQLVQLKHVSLVECFGLFEDLHRELLGIVMDLVDGQPLDDVIDDPRFDARKRVLVLAHVASALAYVHRRDVVHRDVKLNNVLVTRAFWDAPEDPASVKLIDFGIATQHLNPAPLTQLGHIIGTPPYLAPEQLEPEFWAGSRKPSASADVFSFGVLAWQLLAGDAAAHPTGLGPGAGLNQYARAYRTALEMRWPPTAPEPRWRSFFESTLALHPHARAQNGLALVEAIAQVDRTLLLRTAEDTVPTPIVGTAATAARATESSTWAPASMAAGSTEPGAALGVAAPNAAQRRTEPGAPAREIFGQNPSHARDGAVRSAHTELGSALSPATKRRSSGVLWLVVSLALLGVGGAGIVALVLGAKQLGLWGNDAPPTPSASARPAVPIGTVAAPTGTVPAPIDQSQPSEPASSPDPSLPSKCQSSDELCTCCPSGRSCGPGSCRDALQPAEEFSLRLWSVKAAGMRPPLLTEPSIRVCVGRMRDPSTPVCTRLRETLGGRMTAPLRVTTEDLTRHGLSIAVEGPTWRRAKVAVHERGILRSARCMGLSFGDFGSSDFDSVLFYLDDPADPAASVHACQARLGASELAPNDREHVGTRSAWDWGGECYRYAKSGYYAWATAACEQGLKMESSSSTRASLLYNMAMAEQGRGNVEAARRHYGQSLSLRTPSSPGYAEVKKALDRLDVP